MKHRLRFLPEVAGDVVAGWRGLLKRFPYFICYVVEGDLILVVGLFHSARRPATTAATEAVASASATTARSACATRCGLINLCLWRPAHAALETGNMDEWIEYFCAVAHERALAISQSQLEGA
jgi:hypothetical protein